MGIFRAKSQQVLSYDRVEGMAGSSMPEWQRKELSQREESLRREREEEERQKQEQLNLSKAYKIEKARFEAEWAGRIEAVEAECAEKERVLKEVREIATSASGASARIAR